MNKVIEKDTDIGDLTNRRISWGAIFAGVLIAIISQITLNILGLAIGAAALDPAEATNPIGPTFSTGAVVWIASSTLLSIFAGGFVASHLAGIMDELDATLHGLVTWALTTITMFLLLTSTASSIVSGVSTLVSEGIGLIGAGIEDVAPEVLEAYDVRDTLLESIQEEAGNFEQVSGDASAQLVIAVTNLVRAEAESEEADEARQVALNLLQEEAGLTEAEQTLNNWEEQYRQVAQDAVTIAETATTNLADALAAVSGVLFVMLVVGAFAGGAGGLLGQTELMD